MKQPFIVFTSGRSRTAWLASFLTYGDCVCHFEELGRSPTIACAHRQLRPGIGFAETSVAPIWRSLDVEGVARVVIRRPIDEICESFRIAVDGRASIDLMALRARIFESCKFLDEISLQPNTITAEFCDLAKEEMCRRIFEHCLPYEFDRGWFIQMKDKIVDVDILKCLGELD